MAGSLMTITDPSRDEPLVVGDLHTAVDILERLGQAAAKNGTMDKINVEKFMEVTSVFVTFPAVSYIKSFVKKRLHG